MEIIKKDIIQILIVTLFFLVVVAVLFYLDYRFDTIEKLSEIVYQKIF